jgi:hypothetical protein
MAAADAEADRERQRLERVGMEDPLHGLLVASHVREEDGVPGLGVGMLGLQLQRPAELLLCRRPVPVEEEVNHAEPGVSFGEPGVESQCLERRRFGLWHGLIRREIAEFREAAERPALRESGMCEGKAGVLLHCLLEVLDGEGEPVDTALVCGVPAPQIQSVGIERHCRPLHQIGRLAGLLKRQRGHDRLGQLLLQSEHMLHGALVALRPEITPINRVHELGVEADPVTDLPDAPLH